MDLLCLGTAQPGQLERLGCHRLMGAPQDGVAGGRGWDGAAGECTVKGLWLPSSQPETPGAQDRPGEGRSSLPHPFPLGEEEGPVAYWIAGLAPGTT